MILIINEVDVFKMPETRRFFGSKMGSDRRERARESLGRAEKHNRDAATKIARARSEISRIVASRDLR